MIGTRTWWLKQGALIATVAGAFVLLTGLYGLIAQPSSRALVVVGVGIALLLAGGLTWRRLSRRDSVERLESQIYGPEW